MSVQYLLTNVTFDNTYQNVPYFSNVTDRDNALIGDKQFTTTNHNFNFGNVLYTSFVVNRYNWENYLIIKDADNRYRFYFIVQCDYKSVNQWVLTLELDVITQYINGIDSTVLSECYIERGHCNRFISENEKYMFHVKQSNQIVKSEQNINKVPYTRAKVNFKYSYNSNIDNMEQVNNWINDNVLGWVYIFLDNNQKYNFESLVDIATVTNSFTTSATVEIENDYTVCCFPILREGKKIYLYYDLQQNGRNYHFRGYWNCDNLTKFYTSYKQYVYNIKISNLPPCDFTMFYVDNDDLACMVYANVSGIPSFPHANYHEMEGVGIFPNYGETLEPIPDITNTDVYIYYNVICSNIEMQDGNINTLTYNSNFKYSFTASQIKGDRNIELEPKVLLDCYEIEIQDFSNGRYIYNPLHYGTSEIETLYNESVNIGNNNIYFRLLSKGIISDVENNNWNGIVNSSNNSLVVATDNLQNYLNLNKNKLIIDNGLSILNGVIAGATGNIAGVGGAGLSLINTLQNIQNVANKSNSLRNANDEISLNLIVNNGIKPYIAINKALDVDIQKYYNYIYKYGYNVDIIDNPYNYINTRKYFNYIKCDLEGVNIPAPDNVINKIRTIFRNGVRLWNEYEDMYNYNKENYEKWLERLV